MDSPTTHASSPNETIYMDTTYSYIIARFGTVTHNISRTSTYEDAVKSCRIAFALSDAWDVSLLRATWDCVAPTEESWASICDTANEVTVNARLKRGVLLFGPTNPPPSLNPPSSANGGTGPATLIIPSTPTVSEGPSNQTTPPRPQPPATLQHPWSNRPMFIFSAAQGPSTPVRRRVPAVLAPPDENAPPPYSIPPDVNRKITFEVTTSLGDSVMLSAKLCVRLTKTLEAACAILKLDPARCRLLHQGRVLGHGEMDRMTLSSIDLDEGDKLGICWDELTIRSQLWFRPAPSSSPSTPHAIYGSGRRIHVSVSAPAQWTFDDVSPKTAIDRAFTSNPIAASHSRVQWRPHLMGDKDNLIFDDLVGRIACLSWELQSRPLITTPDPTQVQSLNVDAGGLAQLAQLEQRPDQLAVGGAEREEAPLFKPVNFLLILSDVIEPLYYLLFVILLPFLHRLIRPSITTTDNSGTALRTSKDEPKFDAANPSACLTDDDGGTILVKGAEVEACLKKLYGEMDVPDDIVEQFLSPRLPEMVCHRYVALRMLSSSTSIRMSPEPERLVRAFLVYAGVPTEEVEAGAGGWPRAQERGKAIAAKRGGGAGRKSTAIAPTGYRAYELSWVEVILEDP